MSPGALAGCLGTALLLESVVTSQPVAADPAPRIVVLLGAEEVPEIPSRTLDTIATISINESID